ncbi:MAG: phosphoribosylformylglycinamidine synthase subunit PurS [Synergistetes bacterium]|nr:phosphoribosylformylglycinamidine synthase subunit PurS [Synergistota bacterium]
MVKVKLLITLKEGILDAQGKTIKGSLANLGYKNVKDVKVGKILELYIDAKDSEEAIKMTKEMAKKLLVNPIMEDYSIEVDES